MEYTISNLTTNITRKATVNSFTFDDKNNVMFLSLMIRHYVDGIILKDMDKCADFIVNNDDPILPDSTGDFDYIYAMVATVPVSSILEMSIGILDSTGKIDTKCNYRYNVE